jgi:peptidoglycan/LPS O-acetylase OafA/YrhL
MNLLCPPEITREYSPELRGLRALAGFILLFYHLNFDRMKEKYLKR